MLRIHVGDLIDGLHDKLTIQIGRALRHSLAATQVAAAAGRRTPSLPDAVQECVDEADFEALGKRKQSSFWSRFQTFEEFLPPM